MKLENINWYYLKALEILNPIRTIVSKVIIILDETEMKTKYIPKKNSQKFNLFFLEANYNMKHGHHCVHLCKSFLKRPITLVWLRNWRICGINLLTHLNITFTSPLFEKNITQPRRLTQSIQNTHSLVNISGTTTKWTSSERPWKTGLDDGLFSR